MPGEPGHFSFKHYFFGLDLLFFFGLIFSAAQWF